MIERTLRHNRTVETAEKGHIKDFIIQKLLLHTMSTSVYHSRQNSWQRYFACGDHEYILMHKQFSRPIINVKKPYSLPCASEEIPC